MLYRKHHHVTIAKENPGLDNPQLSKLIAKIWNSEKDEEKNKWKLRAEDAVKQHAQQYPGYRYKPRRRGQFVEPRNSDGSCSRCGGYPITPGTAHLKTPAGLPPTPRTGLPHEEPWVRDRPQPGPSSYEPEKRGSENYGFVSPQGKRRRLPDSAGGARPANIQTGLYSRPPGQLANTPRGGDRYVGTPLPNMTSLMAQGAMPPPPVPHGRGGGPGRGRGGLPDEWVQLPPLQTRIPTSPARGGDVRMGYTPTSAVHPGPEEMEMRDQSLMEQILSIPLEWKLGVVEHVNPPLERPNVSPNAESRGAIISIEGPDKKFLAAVEGIVEKALLVTEQTDVKCWVNEYAHIGAFNEDPFQRESLPAIQDVVPYIFQHINEWHEKMQYIVRHIHSKPGQERRPRATTPVALIKRGFSLTVSDRLSGRTDPSTRFKVVDHWRWMVGLWRGLPGPDLVVYVKPSSHEEIAKSGTVEFQRRLRLIMVRVNGEDGLEESTARRIQFELIEWMREGWIHAETPRS